MILLVRHAHAVAREGWAAEDELRPLSRKGERQAEALAGELGPVGTTQLLSSPARRCLATLAPLARARGLPVEVVRALAEGSAGADCLAELLAWAATLETLVACTHGDVLGEILTQLLAEGVPLSSPPAVPKAGTWELACEGGVVLSARLRPPPTLERR